MSIKQKIESISSKVILLVIACGVWVIVLQNAGVIPTSQKVYVTGGYVRVNGSVDVDNSVSVYGRVGVDNTVSVSIDAVLGRDGKKYYYNNFR